MEKSNKSKNLCSDSPEESSWTFYFEDFLCNNNDYEKSDNCYENNDNNNNNSVVSDAASSVAKKVGDINGFCWDRKGVKKLSFKKRKTKGGIVDDALEDTASSPVNSPKLGYFNQPDMMNRKEKENLEISEEKGGNCVLPDERSSEFGIAGGDNNHTELKKRGLCLVPVSALANYFA